MQEDWAEQRRIEKELERIKKENIARLTNPCHVFLTFQNEEGAERAKQYNTLCSADESLEDIRLWQG